MISNTVKYSSAPTISDSQKVNDDHPQNNSESSALTSGISFVRNSENMIFTKKNNSIPVTDGFFTRVWRCFQTSYGKYSNRNICDTEDTELTEILTQGENLSQQANSLFSPDSEAPVPRGWRGSLLKRCLVGAGLLTGSGVMGGVGYAGYKYYNARGESTEIPEKNMQSGSLHTIPEAVKMQESYGGSLEDSFGHHVFHHDEQTNIARHHRRHLLPASDYNFTKSNLNNDEGVGHSQNTLKRANHRVIKLLYKEKLLSNTKPRNKEKMLYAVSQYLHFNNNVDVQDKSNTKSLAQKILFGSGVYGEKENEQLSSEQAKSVVRYWVFKNIFSTTLGKYIEIKMKLDMARDYTVNDIHRLFSVDKLPVMNNVHLDRLTKTEQSSFLMMWKDFLLEEMPFLAFDDEKIKSIPLNDSNFANLYSGSRFIRNIKGEEFSFEEHSSEEIMAVGESMWELATVEGVHEDKIAYYLTPALLFNAASPDDVKSKIESDINILNSYLNYRGNINSVASDIKNKTNIYLSAARSWLNKGSLANKIIQECTSDIFRDVSVRRAAQQNYLDNIMKPCDNVPDNLGDEYTKQTASVADSFREIDKYLMLPAFNLLPADEQAFISSPNAVIHMAKLLINSNYLARLVQNGNSNKEIITPLNNTVIFTVQQDKQERIYALKEIKSNQEYYKLIRVDRILHNYLQNKILDKSVMAKYEMPEFFYRNLNALYNYYFYIGRYNFDEIFKIDKEPILIKKDNMSSLIDSLRDSHRITLFNNLYQRGNDRSDLEKVWDFAKHIIPFYDCTDSIEEENIVAATFQCSLDAMIFIPVLAQATKLTVKFGTGVTWGLYKDMASVGEQGIKAAVSNTLREVSLPTTAELASLGINTLKALDPGFSILMSAPRIGRTFIKKIVKLISEKKEMASLVTSLENRIAKLPLITASKPVTGILANTEREISVLAVGEQDGENIYVEVNPETEEKLGTKYICRGKGELLPLSSILGRHKRSEADTYMSRLVNNTHNRVKRMDNNLLQCPPPLSISPGSRRYINTYPSVIDIENIPRQNKFLTRAPVHPYMDRFVDFNADRGPVAEEMRARIRTSYRSENFFAYRLSESPEVIPPQYDRLRDRLGIYRSAVDRGKRLVETLDDHFRFIKIKKLTRAPEGDAKLRIIEDYLSDVLRLDTIDDIHIKKIIKEESMTRLQDYIRDMKFYFNNEIDNIYFVTANMHPYDMTRARGIERVGGFIFPVDEFRRVIIMPDFFLVRDLDRYLSETILHEVSHIAGTFDYHVSSGAGIQDCMAKFNNVALGIEPGYIEFDDDVMEYYQHTTRRKLSKVQLTNIIRRDPVLRANLFMDNAYYLPEMIERLCALLE